VEESVTEAGRGKGGGGEAEPGVLLEILQIDRIEEKFHQQFLKIVMVAIPELRQTSGFQRPVSESERPITSHAAASHRAVSERTEGQEHLDQVGEERAPAEIPRKRITGCHARDGNIQRRKVERWQGPPEELLRTGQHAGYVTVNRGLKPNQ
jgi:hypothetical protein